MFDKIIPKKILSSLEDFQKGMGCFGQNQILQGVYGEYELSGDIFESLLFTNILNLQFLKP